MERHHIADAKSGTPKVIARDTSPRTMFEGASIKCPEAPVGCKALRRAKGEADYLAEVDALGFSIVRQEHPTTGEVRFALARGNFRGPFKATTPGGAALEASSSLGLFSSLPARSFYKVAGWLGHALAEQGEAVHFPAHGSAVWGCTELHLNADNHPALAAIFEHSQQWSR